MSNNNNQIKFLQKNALHTFFKGGDLEILQRLGSSYDIMSLLLRLDYLLSFLDWWCQLTLFHGIFFYNLKKKSKLIPYLIYIWIQSGSRQVYCSRDVLLRLISMISDLLLVINTYKGADQVRELTAAQRLQLLIPISNTRASKPDHRPFAFPGCMLCTECSWFAWRVTPVNTAS